MNKEKITNIIYRLFLTLALLTSASGARAFSPDFYAANSRLSNGRWVKVSVSESGIHRITTADLRRMGFTDPSKIRIFGYGGEVISNQLSSANYIDDIPQVPHEVTTEGIYFYAKGPRLRETVISGRYRYSENPFSDKGFYFITEDAEIQPLEITSSGTGSASNPATSFNEVLHHEKDLVSPGETGYMFVGEDFTTNSKQTFKFKLTGIVPGSDVWSQISFVAASSITTGYEVSLNGEKLPAVAADRLTGITSSYVYARESKGSRIFKAPESGTAEITIDYGTSSSVKMANLNYITLNYQRLLAIDNGKLDFYLRGAGKIEGVTEGTRLWDVTNPHKIYKIENQAGVFSPSFGGERHYIAWTPGATYPTPKIVGVVANQDIHGTETPDMVIFCHPEWISQGDRIAAHHSSEGENLKVLVLNWNQVYNEFSSGVPDASAFRKCLKMFYDRPGEKKLRYAILFGRATYDNRHVVNGTPRNAMPTWQTAFSLDENNSYTTDDFYTFLEDNSGVNMSADKMSIAIGRLPARNATEARLLVDKLLTYSKSAPTGAWRSKILMIADDQDNGQHLKQSESMWNNMLENGGNNLIYNKVYLDSYPKIGNTYPMAKEDMFKFIDEGTIWWNFIGHANTTSWTHENLLTYTDMNSLYNRIWPVIYAATCSFMRWDAASISAAEIMAKNDNGGAAAVISATRPVLISENKYICESVGRYVFSKGEDGKIIPIGEAIRLAKNNYMQGGVWRANENKLKFVYLGDPAMRLAIPDNQVIVTHINDTPVNNEEPPVIMASQIAKVKGYVAENDAIISDFNGILNATLYDAEQTKVSLGNGSEGTEEPFEDHGSKLFAGSTKVTSGEFELTIPMPAEIADNYRNASIGMYARETSGNRQAAGVNRDFYVYGIDENAVEDNVAPSINSFYLNHSSFRDGDFVNPSPMALAEISDDIGLNQSNAGVGHQMMLYLDRPEEAYSDVSSYFYPSEDGSPSGTIAYPLSNLSEGEHTLTLRIWDTSGNFTEKTISFVVRDNIAPNIFEVYTDANPATVEANFYLSHNRPDAMVNITLEVFNISGQRVWTSTQEGRSDLFESFPIRWNLCDMAGRRVDRGIYIYRAHMKEANGTVSNSVSRKIAVAAQ